MKLTLIRLFTLAVLAGSLSACSGGSSSDPYYQPWYDVYGNYCGSGTPTSGCNFYSDGTKITLWDDPYYSDSILLTYDYWSYTDSWGYRQNYKGYAWLSSDGILYDEYGNALNEMSDTSVSADVIAQAAEKAQQVSQAVGKALAQKYALQEDKGVMISKTLQDWAQLGRDRARTEADVSDFASRLYGIDATKAKGAIQQALATQSEKPLEDMNVDVAAYWGTSPEVSKQILKSWYKQEASTYGIK